MTLDGSEAARSAPFRRIQFGLIIGVILLVAGIIGVCFLARPQPFVRPFPETSEIESMEAEVDLRAYKRNETFQVPASHWDAILSALLPAQKDDDPAKWVTIGRLNLKQKDGSSYYIDLFLLGDPGAFAAGPTHSQRVYYRGGKSTDLEKAVTEAFEASEKKKKDSASQK